MMPLLVTICNDKWAYCHLLRWYRYARERSGCRLGLILISDNAKLESELRGKFDKVVRFTAEHDIREFYNSVRLDACALFDEDAVIYCDCDADVWADISGVVLECPLPLGCVESPAKHDAWKAVARNPDGPEYNNGFLVIKDRQGCVLEAYMREFDKLVDVPARIKGTLAFNKMLESMEFCALDNLYSVIWWDHMRVKEGKVMQWCNDEGQACRVRLEKLWLQSFGTQKSAITSMPLPCRAGCPSISGQEMTGSLGKSSDIQVPTLSLPVAGLGDDL